MSKTRILVMASGEGTLFRHLCTHQELIPCEIVGLIASRDNIGALQVAREFNVPFNVVSKKIYSNERDWEDAQVEAVQKYSPDYIVLAGYLKKIPESLLSKFPQKIINSHPSLLPKYGGKGMYGSNVHRAVLEAGEPQSGYTVHYVEGEYDSGAIILQKPVVVLNDDTIKKLESRVKEAEREGVIAALAQIFSIEGPEDE